MPEDGLWLDGPTELSIDDVNPKDADAQQIRREFHRRRNLLATHVYMWKQKCRNGEIIPVGIGYVNSDSEDADDGNDEPI